MKHSQADSLVDVPLYRSDMYWNIEMSNKSRWVNMDLYATEKYVKTIHQKKAFVSSRYVGTFYFAVIIRWCVQMLRNDRIMNYEDLGVLLENMAPFKERYSYCMHGQTAV